jgi:tRNA(adenine34) deaminase
MTRGNEYFMRLALEEAEAAFKKDEVPVGACLVLDNKVIASARNRKEASNDPTAHAELIAIREGARTLNSWRLNDATLYVTKEPCVMCAGAMVNARLGSLVYGCRDIRYGAVDSQYQLLTETVLNHEVRVMSGVLEHDCSEILKKFFKVRR